MSTNYIVWEIKSIIWTQFNYISYTLGTKLEVSMKLLENGALKSRIYLHTDNYKNISSLPRAKSCHQIAGIVVGNCTFLARAGWNRLLCYTEAHVIQCWSVRIQTMGTMYASQGLNFALKVDKLWHIGADIDVSYNNVNYYWFQWSYSGFTPM